MDSGSARVAGVSGEMIGVGCEVGSVRVGVL